MFPWSWEALDLGYSMNKTWVLSAVTNSWSHSACLHLLCDLKMRTTSFLYLYHYSTQIHFPLWFEETILFISGWGIIEKQCQSYSGRFESLADLNSSVERCLASTAAPGHCPLPTLKVMHASSQTLTKEGLFFGKCISTGCFKPFCSSILQNSPLKVNNWHLCTVTQVICDFKIILNNQCHKSIFVYILFIIDS